MESITFSKLNTFGSNKNYIGLSLRTNIEKMVKNIVFIIDNRTLYYQYSVITQNLPRIILNNRFTVDFANMYMITTYPQIKCIKLNENNIFFEMSKIQKPHNNDVTCDHFDDVFKEVYSIDFVKDALDEFEDRNNNVEIIILSNVKSILLTPKIKQDLLKLSDTNNVVYYNFNTTNNKDGILNEFNMKYFTNVNNGIVGNNEFVNFIKNYCYGMNTLKVLNLVNATHIGSYNETVNIKLNDDIMIEQIDPNKEVIVELYDEHGDKLIKSYTMDKKLDDCNIVSYVGNTLDNIQTNYKYLSKEQTEYAYTTINIIKKIIKNEYANSQKNGDLETSRKLVWIINLSKEIYSVVLEHMLKYSSQNSNGDTINELTWKSKTNAQSIRIKNELNDRIINNLEMLKQVDKLFDIDTEIEHFINMHESMNEINYMDSLDTFYSVITVSNWIDELKNGSSMGLLIKLNIDDTTKLGILKTHTMVEEITLTCLSIKDYIDSTLNHFKKHNECFGDLNNVNIVKGNGIGTSNAVIPLYIHKQHWKQGKKHLPFVLGITLAHNPLGYNTKHNNFMYYLLMDMTRRTYSKNNNFSVKWIKMYMSLLRTCTELAVESEYHKGLKKLLTNYLNNTQKMKMRPFDCDVIMGQILCLGTNLLEHEIKNLIQHMYEDIVKDKVRSQYNKNYVQYLTSLSGEELNNEINGIINFIDTKTNYSVALLTSFYNMYYNLKNITKELGGFLRLINLIDNYYGNLPDELCKKIMNQVKIQDILSYKDLYNLLDVTNCKTYFFTVVMKSIYEPHNIGEQLNKAVDCCDIVNIYANFNKTVSKIQL